MQAIILAAGMGKRLKDLTRNNTKCMVKVDEVTLIERMLHQIERFYLSKVIIVIGYEGQKLMDYISTLNIQIPIIYVNNSVYYKTNNIYSLFLAKDYLCKEDTLLFESDIIFEDDVLKELVNDPRDTLALVAKYESWMDGTCVKVTEEDDIEEFISKKKFKFSEIKQYYKTVNIYKFSKHFSETLYVPFLNAYYKAFGDNEYYEQVLSVITMLDNPGIKVKRLNGQLWYEIDNLLDLDIATSMFARDEGKKLELISGRYGGYWRYPNLLDFCYLVNPYFPPKRLMNEIKANAEDLLTRYPSGMEVNALIAAKNFGVHQENILVGNGAAELIKVLMEQLSGMVGLVQPSFEEYPNRYNREKILFFIPKNKDYSYTVDDLIEFFERKDIENLIVINPDNPSGNYIPRRDILKLLEWTKRKKIKLVIDESFIDFADEEDATIIDLDILNANQHLYVIKSISKSYGIPGLRLGVLASGNTEQISRLKKDVGIWNINSFAEFYMQIFEKYEKDYKDSLVLIKTERERFQNELSKIHDIYVIPSQANYIMVKLTNNMTSKELTKKMLLKYNLLVKDLSKKIQEGNYLRLAVRNTDDNNRLIAALKNELR